MNLISTDSLQLITSAAQNTDVLVHWFDLVTSTKVLSASRTRTNITTATTTTILTAPAAGVERTVKLISVRNRGAAPNTVTLVFNDGVNTTQPISVTLQIGDSLHFNFNVWQVLDNSGQVKQTVTTVAAPHTHTLVDITDVTITSTNLNILDDGVDTTLHFHASDRARANHTGTQSITTVTGTKAEFDAAVSDGNILYVGDITQYTDEMAQDAVGAMVDGSLTYVDGTPLLQRSALTGAITAAAGSNTTTLGSFTKAQLDAALSDGNALYVGDAPTAHTHTASEITDFSEAVDDRVGTLIVAGTNITATYNDGAGTLTIDAAGGGGLTPLTSTDTGTQHDWSPGSLGADTFVEWTGTTSLLATGIDGGSNGYRLAFMNKSVNQVMVFALSNTSSSSANRLSVESRDPVIILPGETAVFIHNGSNWLLAQAPSGGPRCNWNEFKITPGAGGSYGVLGTSAFNNGGTAGTAGLGNPPSTFKDSAPRQTWATGAGAGTLTGIRTNPTIFHRSATSGIGGGYGVFVWSFDTLPASANTWFVGFGPGTIGPSNIDASARTEQIGWGRDPADATNAWLMHNDSGGTSTKTSLGATFPENTTVVFGGAIWMAGNSSGFATVLWRRDDVTVTPSVNDVTTNIPTANLQLQPILLFGNRAAAANYVFSSHQPMHLWGP